jgi:RNA polymerase sigma-32 factor
MLEAQEEQTLAKRWREQGDRAAADRLVTSHLRLVAKIAWEFRGYGLPMADLISEGSLGMLEAVKRYDPVRGFRLASYATWWIRAQIQDYVHRSWSLVRLGTSANQRKLFFNLRRLKAQLRAIEEGELSPDAVAQIAADLAVPATDVVAVNRRLSNPDASLNTPLPDSDAEWQDRLADERSDQESQLSDQEQTHRRRAMLGIALSRLKPRERAIVTARRLGDEPTPLAVLAIRFHVTAERIRQIERGAVAKLGRLVREIDRAPSSRQPLAKSTADLRLRAGCKVRAFSPAQRAGSLDRVSDLQPMESDVVHARSDTGDFRSSGSSGGSDVYTPISNGF